MNSDLAIAIRNMAHDIIYELDNGVHTYHQCECGRESTRAGMCWRCKLEEMAALADVGGVCEWCGESGVIEIGFCSRGCMKEWESHNL